VRRMLKTCACGPSLKQRHHPLQTGTAWQAAALHERLKASAAGAAALAQRVAACEGDLALACARLPGGGNGDPGSDPSAAAALEAARGAAVAAARAAAAAERGALEREAAAARAALQGRLEQQERDAQARRPPLPGRPRGGGARARGRL